MNRRRSPYRPYICGPIFLLVVLTTVVYGQVTTATIFGTVVDSSGATVPLAEVTATNELTGTMKTGIANNRGEVTITFVPVGVYTISIEAAGFKKYRESGLALVAGENANLKFSLEIGAVSETLNVTADRPLLEATSAQQNVTIDAVQRAELPLTSRDFSNVVNLATGAIAGSSESLGSAGSS